MASWRIFAGLLVLFGGVWWARGAGESWLNKFGKVLHTELSDLIEEVHVDYYEAVINTTFNSTSEFNMRGMAPLYNSTTVIIDVIAKKDAYPEGIVSISDGNIEIANLGDNWRKLLSHYAGPVAVISVAVLLIAILPLAGLFWCCCYWCRYGRRRRPFDRKYDACLKGLLAILLIALLTLFLFGVVCAFASDEHLETNSRTGTETGRTAVADVRAYLNDTGAHAHWLLVVNFGQLEDTLNEMLNNSGVTISVQLGEFSRAVSVTTLNKMVQQLDSVQADLRTVHNVTGDLRYSAERLNSGLRKVKGQLLQTLANCEQPQCRRLQEKYKIGQLDTEIQYSQMPDVSELLRNVTQLLDSDIKREVAEGQQVFTDLQRGIQRSVNKNIPTIQDSIAETGKMLRNISKVLTRQAEEYSYVLKRDSDSLFMTIDDAINNYGIYRRYIGIGVAASLLAITCLLALGLVCGVCGKRPDVYGASDCCNKGAGSKWMLCGMCVTFVVGAVVCSVLVVYFVVGVVSQRFVCDPLTEPRGNRVFADFVDRLMDLEGSLFGEHKDPNFNYTSALVSCHRNDTIYKSLHLERSLDLEGLRRRINEEVGRQTEGLRPRYPAADRDVVILKPPAKVKLQQLADTGLSDFNFDRILQALETNITSLALDSLSNQLEATAKELTGRSGFTRVTMELRDAAALLSAYQRDIVQPMLGGTAALTSVAMSLRDGLRFNHTSLKEAVSHLLQETEAAETFLNRQGPALIRNLTHDFTESMVAALNVYLDRVISAMEYEVGRCGPVSQAYNATLNATCRKILMPVNGYWISIAWCVLLFVPILIVSQRLARLYLHVDPYPGPIVEAEYLYDAYADRDNVPLANSYKAEKRSRRETRVSGSGGGGGAGGGEGRARDLGPGAAPAVDTHHARRYNDMAPNTMELNNFESNIHSPVDNFTANNSLAEMNDNLSGQEVWKQRRSAVNHFPLMIGIEQGRSHRNVAEPESGINQINTSNPNELWKQRKRAATDLLPIIGVMQSNENSERNGNEPNNGTKELNTANPKELWERRKQAANDFPAIIGVIQSNGHLERNGNEPKNGTKELNTANPKELWERRKQAANDFPPVMGVMQKSGKSEREDNKSKSETKISTANPKELFEQRKRAVNNLPPIIGVIQHNGKSEKDDNGPKSGTKEINSVNPKELWEQRKRADNDFLPIIGVIQNSGKSEINNNGPETNGINKSNSKEIWEQRKKTANTFSHKSEIANIANFNKDHKEILNERKKLANSFPHRVVKDPSDNLTSKEKWDHRKKLANGYTEKSKITESSVKPERPKRTKRGTNQKDRRDAKPNTKNPINAYWTEERLQQYSSNGIFPNGGHSLLNKELHWEEGPPRYHGPTEYERPPPYYYPGPNDRQ